MKNSIFSNLTLFDTARLNEVYNDLTLFERTIKHPYKQLKVIEN